MEQNLFQKGVDAWWLDATEPNLWSIQGAYHTFQRNREGDMDTLIDVLGDITEVVKGVYEKRH